MSAGQWVNASLHKKKERKKRKRNNVTERKSFLGLINYYHMNFEKCFRFLETLHCTTERSEVFH